MYFKNLIIMHVIYMLQKYGGKGFLNFYLRKRFLNFLAVLGLHCCVQAFSNSGEW